MEGFMEAKLIPDILCAWQGNIDFLTRLVARNVRFVIVGSTATRFYLPEREVDDLDLLIDPVEENAELFIDALKDGNNFQYNILPSALAKPKQHMPVKDYLYVDILTPASASEFDAIWSSSVEARIADEMPAVRVRVAALATLITMLSSSDQAKHLSDVKALIERGDANKQKG